MAERSYFSVLESRFIFYDDAFAANIETRVSSGGGTMAEPWVDRHWSVVEARKQLVCAERWGNADVIDYMRNQLQFAEDRAQNRCWQDPPPPRSESAQIPPEIALLLNPDVGQVAHVSRQAEEATRQAEQMRQQAEQSMAEAKAMMEKSTAQLKVMEELASQPRLPVSARTRPRLPAYRGRRFRFDEED